MDAPDPMDAPYTPCTATSKQSGQRCKGRPIPGGTVCVMHGGRAPHVQAKAAERLRAMQDIAIERLAELIEQRDSPSVAYHAAREVLDRTMGRPQKSKSNGVSSRPLLPLMVVMQAAPGEPDSGTLTAARHSTSAGRPAGEFACERPLTSAAQRHSASERPMMNGATRGRSDVRA